MAFNVQENAVFIHKFSKISLPWEGETTSHTLPPARLLRPLALAARRQILAAPLSLAKLRGKSTLLSVRLE